MVIATNANSMCRAPNSPKQQIAPMSGRQEVTWGQKTDMNQGSEIVFSQNLYFSRIPGSLSRRGSQSSKTVSSQNFKEFPVSCGGGLAKAM